MNSKLNPWRSIIVLFLLMTYGDYVRADTSNYQSSIEFRDRLGIVLSEQGSEAHDINQIIAPTPQDWTAPSGDLADIEQALAGEQVEEWFAEAQNIPLTPRPAKKSRQATIIVVPGIGGELLAELPFSELDSKWRSRFYLRNRLRLVGKKASVYAVFEDKLVENPLHQLVKLNSIRLRSGADLNIIHLGAPAGSLETLGRIDDNAYTYLHRLNILFNAIEDDSDIYLLGYSRGLSVALELARIADIDAPDTGWRSRIQGVIGVAGTYYGADGATNALNPSETTLESRAIELLTGIADSLQLAEEGDSLWRRWQIVRANTRLWVQAVKAAGDLGIDFDPDFILEQESRQLEDYNVIKTVDPLGLLETGKTLLFKAFRLHRPISKYNQNVAAFKRSLRAVREGLYSITFEARDEWWRNHRLPAELKLYSLAGSMPAPLRGELSPLFGFQGYGIDSSDFLELTRPRYYLAIRTFGTEFNDSMLKFAHARYWPGAYPGHNNEHHFLGVLGSHHIGVGLPFILKDRDSSTANQFPRSAVLQAIGEYL